jgi:hypothetical protein
MIDMMLPSHGSLTESADRADKVWRVSMIIATPFAPPDPLQLPLQFMQIAMTILAQPYGARTNGRR